MNADSGKRYLPLNNPLQRPGIVQGRSSCRSKANTMAEHLAYRRWRPGHSST